MLVSGAAQLASYSVAVPPAMRQKKSRGPLKNAHQIDTMIAHYGGKMRSDNGMGAARNRIGSSLADNCGSLLSENGRLHHLGFVVASISRAAGKLAISMGLRWDGKVIHDPLQRVRVSFFCPVDTRNPVFELVEPAGDGSPVSSFLKKGGGLHHVCYEIDDLESGLWQAERTGFAIFAAPAPAVAFEGRRIAWVCSRSRLLMELLERERK